VFTSSPPPALLQQLLWEETFTCVVRADGPLARGKLDRARYLAANHLFISPRGRPGSFIDDWLAERGLTRRIALTVPHFLVAPPIIAATDLMWTAPTSLARAYAQQLPLRLRATPFAVMGFQIAMRWHIRLDRDPGLAWLRAQLLATRPHGIA